MTITLSGTPLQRVSITTNFHLSTPVVYQETDPCSHLDSIEFPM